MNGIPEAAIWRGGPTLARIKQLQAMYNSTAEGWFFQRQRDGSWRRGQTRGFVFGLDARVRRTQPVAQMRYLTCGDDHRNGDLLRGHCNLRGGPNPDREGHFARRSGRKPDPRTFGFGLGIRVETLAPPRMIWGDRVTVA